MKFIDCLRVELWARNIWSFLTDAQWRRRRNIRHPLACLWYLVTAPLVLAAFFAFLLALLVSRGPRTAAALWYEWS